MQKIKRIFPVVALIWWDIVSVICSVSLAIKLTFWMYVKVPKYYESHMVVFIAAISAIVIVCNAICGCYNRVLRTISFSDVVRQFTAVLLEMGVLFVVDVVVRYAYISRNSTANDLGLLPLTTYVILGMSLLLLTVLGRGFARFISSTRAAVIANKSAEPVIIYGAGEAGTYLLKMINGHPDMDMRVVAFIDDDASLHGRKINRVKIAGGLNKLGALIEKYEVRQVIVAIPTAEQSLIFEILDICKKYHCIIKRFGTIEETEPSSMKMREIDLEQLLHRGKVSLNMKVVESFIKDKTVLVTGGAGSIGSEICRQVLRFGCRKLVIFDFSENGLFFIDNELKQKYAGRFVVRLGSIRDRARLGEVFDEFSPEIVFHAAAHKHVPMMEINPREAMKNNVMGTVNVCQTAVMHKVQKFITISTDKAVNPTNIMGASKRITELIMQKCPWFKRQCRPLL